LEEEFGCNISDHFDLICGTSTGGLIALALSQKIPASEICSFYKVHGRAIFPNRKFPLRWLEYLENKLLGGKYFFEQTFFGGKYSNKALREVLNTLFGETKIGDSHNLLCIPTYSMTDGRPWVFKYDHSDLSRDNKALYVDVALATSAAPTYFPIHEIDYYDNKQFIDGGVWANNPTLVGVIEGLKFFVGEDKEFDSIEVLSISSLSLSKGKPTGWGRNRSFVGWRSDLFDTAMNGQSSFTDYIMQTLGALSNIPIKYFRIPSAPISHEQIHLVELDNASPNALSLLSGKGNDMGTIYRKDSNVKFFFNSLKSISLNHG
jgi:hypothetical protein